jgi:uncharacterized protein
MKILAFADTHGSMKAIREVIRKSKLADLVLCCGDLTIFEQAMDRLVAELARIDKPVLMLPGNHEPSPELKKLCSQTHNIVFMDGRIFESNEILIFGAQGNGFMLVDRTFERLHHNFEHMLSQRHSRKYMVMTHAPPYGTELDRIVDGHCGNKSIRNFIKATKPLVAFSGHIHENAGKQDKLGQTILVNPGPYGIEVNI